MVASFIRGMSHGHYEQRCSTAVTGVVEGVAHGTLYMAHGVYYSTGLQERNRKLNTELTKLKNTTAEQQGNIQDLQQQLHKAHSKQQDQKSLIKQLEIDLMHRSHSCLQH